MGLVVLLVVAGTAQFLYGRDREASPVQAARSATAAATSFPSLPRIDLERLRRSVQVSAIAHRRADIFSFVSEQNARAPQSRPLPDPSQRIERPPILEPTAVQFRLVGIAEHLTDGKRVRTAILSDDAGQPRFLEDGESLDAHHRVSHVAADSIILIDTRTNAVRRLSLP